MAHRAVSGSVDPALSFVAARQRPYCARAGITDLNPHCIRHTGATRTYWATKDIYFVSELLNHSDITTTRRYYLKTDPEVARDMMRKVDERRKEKVSAKVSAKRLKLVS